MHEIQVAVTRTAVEVVRAEARPHELLEEVQLFVRAASRNQAGDRLWPDTLADLGEPLNDVVHRLKPRGFDELIPFPDERVLHARRAIEVFESEPSPHAESTMAFCRVRAITPFILPRQRRRDANDLGVLRFDVHLAAIPAVVTSRGRLLHLPGLVEVLRKLVRDRTHRADGK